MYKKIFWPVLIVAISLSCHKAAETPAANQPLIGTWLPVSTNIFMRMDGVTGDASGSETDTFALNSFTGSIQITNDSVIQKNISFHITGHVSGSASGVFDAGQSYDSVINTTLLPQAVNTKYTATGTDSVYFYTSPQANFYGSFINPSPGIFKADTQLGGFLPQQMTYTVSGDTLTVFHTVSNGFEVLGAEVFGRDARGGLLRASANMVFVKQK